MNYLRFNPQLIKDHIFPTPLMGSENPPYGIYVSEPDEWEDPVRYIDGYWVDSGEVDLVIAHYDMPAHAESIRYAMGWVDFETILYTDHDPAYIAEILRNLGPIRLPAFLPKPK